MHHKVFGWCCTKWKMGWPKFFHIFLELGSMDPWSFAEDNLQLGSRKLWENMGWCTTIHLALGSKKVVGKRGFFFFFLSPKRNVDFSFFFFSPERYVDPKPFSNIRVSQILGLIFCFIIWLMDDLLFFMVFTWEEAKLSEKKGAISLSDPWPWARVHVDNQYWFLDLHFWYVTISYK